MEGNVKIQHSGAKWRHAETIQEPVDLQRITRASILTSSRGAGEAWFIAEKGGITYFSYAIFGFAAYIGFYGIPIWP